MPLQDKPTVEQIARPTLEQIDNGRTRIGFAVIIVCALFWIGLGWLLLRLF